MVFIQVALMPIIRFNSNEFQEEMRDDGMNAAVCVLPFLRRDGGSFEKEVEHGFVTLFFFIGQF